MLIDECLSEIGNEPTFSKEFSERLADYFQTTGKRTENFQTITIFNRECDWRIEETFQNWTQQLG